MEKNAEPCPAGAVSRWDEKSKGMGSRKRYGYTGRPCGRGARAKGHQRETTGILSRKWYLG